jgi:tetratricopeptide (TPR) repeat protein
MNENWYEEADDYLNGRMNPQERSDFESKLAGNGEMSSGLKLYKTIETAMQGYEKNKEEEEALRRSLQALRETYFTTTAQPSRSKLYKIFLPAAAILILVAAVYLLVSRPPGPHQLAKEYIGKQLASLGQTMNAPKDSLQQGIAAYNNKDYGKALRLFEWVSRNSPDNSDSKKYTGLVYLQTGDYDKALEQFNELAAVKGLYSNPGLFLEAVTLLQRNSEGDLPRGRALLERVVREKSEGSEEAEKWLQRF